jgi:hypothetical protein
MWEEVALQVIEIADQVVCGRRDGPLAAFQIDNVRIDFGGFAPEVRDSYL